MFKQRFLHLTHHVIFQRQLGFGIFFLNLFGDRKRATQRLANLGHCGEGTLGKTIYNMMKTNSLELVPWYESHDMKHALLGYRQEPPDEIRMQAFMFGNAGFSFFSVFTFLIFVIWTPDTWPDLSSHYRAGKHAKPIGNWVLEDYAARNLDELREEIGLKRTHEKAEKIQVY